MRPLTLTVSAFGPYVGEETIPMERLGETGVYLITGDTGAGKTTIFDAICFALYGTASGDNRTKQMLRSKYADAATPTFVDMTFEYRGQAYRIRRNPEYERPKSRGEGTTAESADAHLYYPDGSVVTGYEKVTRAACELIGLDAKQFSRIAMLAQGDFQKLLNANTEERTEIFRKIFDTVPYRRLQERLSEQANGLRNDFRALSQSLRQYIGDIACDPDSPLQQRLDEAREGESVQVLEMALPVVQEILEADAEALNAVEEKIAQTDRCIEQLAGRIATAERLNEVAVRLEGNRRALEKALPRWEETQTLLEAEKQHIPERERLTAAIGALNERLPEYDALAALTKQGVELSRQQKKKAEQLSQLDARIRDQKEQLAEARQALEALASCEADRASTRHEKEKTTERLNRLCELEKSAETDRRLHREYQQAVQAYRDAAEENDRRSAEYARLERAFLDGQAGVLARSLKEGEPCPVCGSVHHPAPADPCGQAPTEEALEQSKQARDKAGQICANASTEAGICKAAAEQSRESLEKALREEFADLGDGEPYPLAETIRQLQAEGNRLDEKLSVLTAQCDQRQELHRRIPALEEAVEKEEAERTPLLKELAAADERIGLLREQYKESIGRLEFKSKEEAQSAVAAKQNRKALLEEAFRRAQESEQAARDEVQRIQAEIRADEAVLSGAQAEDPAPLKEQYAALTASKKENTAASHVIRMRLSANQSALKNIRLRQAELCETEEKLKSMDALSRTANGSLTGKERFPFETYVQVTYFDRVIASANLRLSTMTGGQYELIRAVSSDNMRTKSGLELNVIDRYNGSQRSVKTLSGGESFKASLALALGLSDVVQSTAGGIQLDAMFIDEGFGSLDEESLEQAMTVLGDLSAGNRLIGIISHVGELKRCIDRQLIVTKDRAAGSHVRIEV